MKLRTLKDLGLIFISAIYLNAITKLQAQLEDSESCALCETRLNEKNIYGLGGIYQEGRYYCVWTEGRTIDEISDINGDKNDK